jgi:hypothetical protein
MIGRQQAFSEEQLTQLLLRLASAPDLSLFRDKWERLEAFTKAGLDHMPLSNQLLRQLEAALTRGLLLLVPLLSLDLPKRALHCITCLQQLLGIAQTQFQQQLAPSVAEKPVETPRKQHTATLDLLDNTGEHASSSTVHCTEPA